MREKTWCGDIFVACKVYICYLYLWVCKLKNIYLVWNQYVPCFTVIWWGKSRLLKGSTWDVCQNSLVVVVFAKYLLWVSYSKGNMSSLFMFCSLMEYGTISSQLCSRFHPTENISSWDEISELSDCSRPSQGHTFLLSQCTPLSSSSSSETSNSPRCSHRQ